MNSTCAVVGSSGALLRGRYGREIDSHAIVLRFNDASTKGFESIVGSKTSIRILNTKAAILLLNHCARNKRVCNATRPSCCDKFVGDSNTAVLINSGRDAVVECFRQTCGRPSANLLHVLSWHPLLTALRTTATKRSLSGFFGLAVALTVCKVVDVYGFSMGSQQHQATPYHYYDECLADATDWQDKRGIAMKEDADVMAMLARTFPQIRFRPASTEPPYELNAARSRQSRNKCNITRQTQSHLQTVFMASRWSSLPPQLRVKSGLRGAYDPTAAQDPSIRFDEVTTFAQQLRLSDAAVAAALPQGIGSSWRTSSVNASLHPLRNPRLPPTQTWDELCASRGTVPTQKQRGAQTPSISMLLSADGRRAFNTTAFTERLLADVHARHVLCDVNSPCRIHLERGMFHQFVLRVCLPPPPRAASSSSSARTRRPVICEPYGERWQQSGGEVHLSQSWKTTTHSLKRSVKSTHWSEEAAMREDDEEAKSAGCIRIYLRRLANWWVSLRSTNRFIINSTIVRAQAGKPAPRRRHNLSLMHLSRSQLLRGKQTITKWTETTEEQLAKLKRDDKYAEDLVSWLDSSEHSRAMRSVAALSPQQLESCAVVGSGHDLKCGKTRGEEIDSHRAVFRSNAFQHPHAAQHSISANRGGRRTSYRVSCLYANKAAVGTDETCVVPRSWWEQSWGRESYNNMRHPCCDKDNKTLMRSSYNLSALRKLEMGGGRVAFLQPVQKSGVAAIDALLSGSGGSALHAAINLCESVTLYGAGLFAAHAQDDKVYVHAYDEDVGKCVPSWRKHEFGSWRGLTNFFEWRRDRVASEILLHVLHALGVVNWVT